MYQLGYIPTKLDNLNVYFTRYRETKDEKYFNEFLYIYEPVLNRNAQLFIKKYDLDSNRIDDLKQIFSSLLWSELQSYDSDIPLLQLIKYRMLKAWHEYVRTVCGNVHIDNNNLYQNLRKVALLYSQQQNDKPLEEAVTDIANELNISKNTVRNCIITSTWFKQNSNLDIHNQESENYFNYSITYVEIDTLSPEEIYFKNEQREKLKTALSKLKPQDLRLIELVFGICSDCLKSKDKKTIREASLRVGLTAEGAEKKIKKILEQLKEELQQ
jgi:DNA-directed RNA polymerase specialized sigma subunit